MAQTAFRLFVRESFCGGVSQPLPIEGFSAVGQPTEPKGKKAPAVMPAAAPMGLKNERRDHQEVAPPIWNMARLHQRHQPHGVAKGLKWV